ncbi:MAG: RidA family protein [Chloroflexi bacterium]|nr:RidA family protein [Chloroflexota bacterium]
MEVQYFRHADAPSGVPPLAARAGDFVFFAGGIAAHPVKGVPEEVKPLHHHPYHGSSIDRQLRYIYDSMAQTLERAGSSIKRGMKINSYHTNSAEIDAALRVRRDYFGAKTPPPSTLVIVPETAVRGASVTNDLIALASGSRMDREALHKKTDQTRPLLDHVYGHPIFVQAVRGGGFIFTQGRPASLAFADKQGIPPGGRILHPDFPYRDNPIKFHTEHALNYLRSVLQDMGASLEHVVKADLHMNDMKDIAGMDEVWRKFFPTDPPARTILPTVQSSPYGIIEIELFAVDPRGPYRKETVFSPGVPQPIGHEPHAIKAGPYLFLSGQLATDYRHGIAPEARVDPSFPFHSSSASRQVEYILKNVDAICQAGGTSVRNLVRRRAMHFDLNELAQAEEVWREALGDGLPPTTIFRTASHLWVPSCTVGYELIAFVPGSSSKGEK